MIHPLHLQSQRGVFLSVWLSTDQRPTAHERGRRKTQHVIVEERVAEIRLSTRLNNPNAARQLRTVLRMRAHVFSNFGIF